MANLSIYMEGAKIARFYLLTVCKKQLRVNQRHSVKPESMKSCNETWKTLLNINVVNTFLGMTPKNTSNKSKIRKMESYQIKKFLYRKKVNEVKSTEWDRIFASLEYRKGLKIKICKKQ